MPSDVIDTGDGKVAAMTTREAAEHRHGIVPAPPGEDAPAFAEPWEAQAFGLVMHLHANGLFTWPEWTDALAAELRRRGAAHGGADHYRHWLAALERLLAERGLLPTSELEATTAAWQRAAHATPHGEPILLENDPEHRADSADRR